MLQIKNLPVGIPKYVFLSRKEGNRLLVIKWEITPSRDVSDMVAPERKFKPHSDILLFNLVFLPNRNKKY